MPVAQTHDTVRHILYRVVMRNHNDGVAVFLIDRLDQLQDLLRGRVIQRSGFFTMARPMAVRCC